ncbi:hypothetical protein [Nocardioides sp. InS609-2]|uniref:hypothetical protein n=1 Tax=Nocardioides sp. InS609-2 TaxID=2760705 RepID=UPI0020C04773|nr:hypothetical protein [Nocardioides sp. InS609-2]
MTSQAVAGTALTLILLGSTAVSCGAETAAPASATGKASSSTARLVHTDQELAHLTDSAQLTTPILAEGRVVDASGAPAADVRLVVLGWPAMTDAADGEEFTLPPVAYASAGEDGRFALHISDPDLLAPLADDDSGLVDVEILVEDSRIELPFNFTVALVDATDGTTTIELPDESEELPVVVELSPGGSVTPADNGELFMEAPAIG